MSRIIENLLQLFLIVIFAIMSFLAVPTWIAIAILNPILAGDLFPVPVGFKPSLLQAGSWVAAGLVVGILCTVGFQSTTVVSLVAGMGIALGVLPASSFQTM